MTESKYTTGGPWVATRKYPDMSQCLWPMRLIEDSTTTEHGDVRRRKTHRKRQTPRSSPPRRRLLEQRDELLKALEAIMERVPVLEHRATRHSLAIRQTCKAVDAAIAKARGEA